MRTRERYFGRVHGHKIEIQGNIQGKGFEVHIDLLAVYLEAAAILYRHFPERPAFEYELFQVTAYLPVIHLFRGRAVVQGELPGYSPAGWVDRTCHAA